MSITTVVLGATMTAMNDAIKATDSAMLLTSMNTGLRTSMDLMVRDLLQVGQGLPSGHVIMIPSGAGATALRMPGPRRARYLTFGGVVAISAVMPGPGLGPVINTVTTDMITTLQVDSSFDVVRLTAFAANGSSVTVDPAATSRTRAPMTSIPAI